MHFWSDSSVVKDGGEKSSNPIAVNNSGEESMIKVVTERKKKFLHFKALAHEKFSQIVI